MEDGSEVQERTVGEWAKVIDRLSHGSAEFTDEQTEESYALAGSMENALRGKRMDEVVQFTLSPTEKYLVDSLY